PLPTKPQQEMKSRVISSLAAMAQQEQAPMTLSVAEAMQLHPSEVQKRAAATLTHILHDYSHFSITTIDSFFHQIIRQFSKEIGLHQGLRVEMDTESVIDQVVDKVYHSLSDNPALTRWLLDYVMEHVLQGKRWDVRFKLKNLSKEVIKEAFYPFDQAIQQLDPGFFAELRVALSQIKQNYENQMRLFGKAGLETIVREGIEEKDFFQGGRGLPTYFRKLVDGSSFEPNSYVLSMLADDRWSSSSKGIQRAMVDMVARRDLRPLLEAAFELWKAAHSKYVGACVALKELYNFGLIREISRGIQAYRSQHQTMLISDTAPFLREIISGAEIPFIYEKFGSFYEHFLIDEFQDTSRLQWQNFLPLLTNSLASGNENLVVGDVKQSIYRWRGGDWELLLNGINQSLGAEQLEEDTLPHNWRSAPKVIHFNNQFFRGAAFLLSSELKDYMVEEILEPTFTKAYKDTEQHVPASAEGAGGYIEVRLFDRGEGRGKNWQEQALIQLCHAVEDLQSRGFKPQEVAILVRKGREGERVAQQLLQHREAAGRPDVVYDVISTDSLYLANSLSVNSLLLALRCAWQPQHRPSRVALAQRLAADLDWPLTEAEWQSGVLPHRVNELIQSPDHLGLYDRAEAFIRVLGLQNWHDEQNFILAFLDGLLRFEAENSADLGGFLTWWDEHGAEQRLALAEDQEAMRLLTIHRAKGLEYRAVIIPFCDWELDARYDHILWCQAESQPFAQAPFLPVRYQSDLQLTEFAPYYADEKIRSYLDNLNLCYVAFTRARQELYIYAGRANTDKLHGKEVRTVETLVEKTLRKGTVLAPDPVEESEYTLWAIGQKAEGSPLASEGSSQLAANLPSEPWGLRIQVKPKPRAPGERPWLMGRPTEKWCMSCWPNYATQSNWHQPWNAA
ncbi:MAG: UvrD-helicase domain-containing protein, partial [Cytophagales bacterium]|nr:UvrD-helicase domain-containing protein [Cytophagales bacterium]